MKIFTVTQINKIIKDLIDNEIVLEDITVSGELSSFSISRNIAYFTLKDNESLLNCVMFGAKQEFSVGDMVQIRGNVKYYPKGGNPQFILNKFIAKSLFLSNTDNFDEIAIIWYSLTEIAAHILFLWVSRVFKYIFLSATFLRCYFLSANQAGIKN